MLTGTAGLARTFFSACRCFKYQKYWALKFSIYVAEYSEKKKKKKKKKKKTRTYLLPFKTPTIPRKCNFMFRIQNVEESKANKWTSGGGGLATYARSPSTAPLTYQSYITIQRTCLEWDSGFARCVRIAIAYGVRMVYMNSSTLSSFFHLFTF